MLTSAAVWALSSPAVAFPPPRVPLWDLIEQADLVAIVEVVSAEAAAGQPSSHRARLAVREVLKGAADATLDVGYDPTTVWPRPPRYEQGKTLLVFLERAENGFTTTGDGYGTIYPREGDLDDFRAAVRAAVQLQQQNAAADRRFRWLLEIAQRPGARWHGLYELHIEEQMIRNFMYPRDTPRGYQLSREDLERLADAFVAAPRADRSFPVMLEVLTPLADPRVDRTALALIEALLLQPVAAEWLDDAMVFLLVRLGDPDPAARMAPCYVGDRRPTVEMLRAVWREAQAQLGFATTEPAELDLKESAVDGYD